MQTGGLRPATVDFSHLRTALRAQKPVRSRLLRAAAPLPSKWDSREHGWVSPIKDQGIYGTCWAFAAIAALETAGLKVTQGAVTNDYSENHMATHDVGFQLGFDEGGNNQLAAALLTSWRDPLREGEDPYGHPDSKVDLPPCCHVQDIVQLPERYCPFFKEGAQYEVGVLEDNREVDEAYKRAVMDYGAVAVSYYHSRECYNSSTAAHYLSAKNYTASSGEGGHGVALIGWDDDYPAENFKGGKRPPGNGAFLVKNSWGQASNTDRGCTWISYYDEAVFLQTGAAYPQPEERENFGRIYQYDPCGQVETWNSADEASETAFTNWCANVFTATATGVVEAVGFYAVAANTEYRLKICRGCAGGPDTGACVAEQSGVVTNAGFATVRLLEPVALPVAGEKFAVVLRLESPGTDFPMSVECDYDETDSEGKPIPWCRCTANAGESFMSKDGETWTDFQKYRTSGNFCIKAYTRFGSDGDFRRLVAGWSPLEKSVNIPIGGSCRFEVEPVEEDASEVTYEWTVNGVKANCSSAAFDFDPSFVHHGNCAVECHVRAGTAADVHVWTAIVNAELHVEASGSSGGDPDGSAERPFSAIQSAIRAAIEGDAVVVGPGVYSGTVEGPSAKIEIRSSDGPEVTVLDARGAGRCYNGSQNEQTVLSGFTLCNANSAGYFGGGAIYGIIADCIISNCVAGAGGGAAYATLVNCRVVGNEAEYYGGGVCDSTATNCLFFGNAAPEGSAAGWDRAGSELYGCTVCENLSNPDGGAIDRGSYCRDSIVWGNFDVDGNVGNWGLLQYGRYSWSVARFAFSCTTPAGFADDGGCTTENPRLAAAVRGDVRLVSGSPCIGAASDGRNMGCDQGAPLENSILEVGRGCAYATIQDALDASVYGDTVRVNPGVYPGVVNPLESVRIESVAGPFETVIDGGGCGRCFDDYGWARLSGFALVNGVAPANDCGGGACFGEVVGCVISNCTATAGGGAAFSDLVNCLVCGNRATDSGGGTYESALYNCTVAGNSAAKYGGGAYLQTVSAANSVIAANSSDAGSASWNDVYGNGWRWMVSSLFGADARFVDAVRGNYRLAADSPCIDAGNNGYVLVESDLDGTNRIFGARVDMGCYEYCRTVPGWPVPAVSPGATREEESAAVADAMKSAGFEEARAAALTSLAQYNAVSAWAADRGLTAAALVASSTAFISPALAASGLLDLRSEDLKIAGLDSGPSGREWVLELALGPYDPATANAALLRAAVGVVGAETPNGRFSSDGIGLSVTPGPERIRVSVMPPDGKEAYFLKSVVR